MIFLIAFVLIATVSCINSSEVQIDKSSTPIRIDTIEDQLVSNESLFVSFNTSDIRSINSLKLMITGSQGSIVLSAIQKDSKPGFTIPGYFLKQSGVISYKLLFQGKMIQEGHFNLSTTSQFVTSIGTYLGPRSIMANERDFTMLTSIPSDKYDNMLPDGTEITLKSQFKNEITTTDHSLNSGFVWKRIASPDSKGRISTTSILNTIASSELVADVFPDIPIDFNLEIHTNHSYADGNEILTLQTSQIHDKNGNVMTDGTLITFHMSDKQGNQWQLSSSTVNGYAFAKALHPQIPSSWDIQASIRDMAKSNSINAEFLPIISNIPYKIKASREIQVGPLTSYMKQLIPNGIEVTLNIGDHQLKQLTKEGNATFYLTKEQFDKGSYSATLRTLGVEETIKLQLD